MSEKFPVEIPADWTYLKHGDAKLARAAMLDRIRCSLSDRSGVLRFEAFDIADAPQLSDAAEKLRRYLVGRSLAEVDIGRLRELTADHGEDLTRAVITVVREQQNLFGPEDNLIH